MKRRESMMRSLLFNPHGRPRGFQSAIALTMVVAAGLVVAGHRAAGQEKSATSMQTLRNELKADMKQFIAANMDLTDAEAKAFWPVYDRYQKDLQKINERLGRMIHTYAEAHNTKSLTDELAKQLTDEALAIEETEVELWKSYAAALGKVLPAKKVARYLQIERKVRAVIRFELAANIPLVQ